MNEVPNAWSGWLLALSIIAPIIGAAVAAWLGYRGKKAEVGQSRDAGLTEREAKLREFMASQLERSNVANAQLTEALDKLKEAHQLQNAQLQASIARERELDEEITGLRTTIIRERQRHSTEMNVMRNQLNSLHGTVASLAQEVLDLRRAVPGGHDPQRARELRQYISEANQRAWPPQNQGGGGGDGEGDDYE